MAGLFTPLINEMHSVRWRGISLIVVFMVVIGSLQTQLYLQQKKAEQVDQQLAVELQHNSQLQLVAAIRELQLKIDAAKAIGADTTDSELKLLALKNEISDYSKTIDIFNAIREEIAIVDAIIIAQTEQNRLAEEQKLSGILAGVVKEGETLLGGVALSLTDGTTTVTATSGSDGAYTITIKAGTYTLTASKSGYNSYKKTGLVVTAQQTLTQNISLSKATAKTTTTTTTTTNGDSKYEKTTVSTSRGNFAAHISTFNLASGQFKVSTDTANDNDCTDNCPVKSLGSYVSANGGFAGMNGTYFCPADYATCAGEVNAFFWKVINTRLGKTINATNGKGENDPFIAFSSSTAKYFSSWNSYISSGFSAVAGINSKPALVSGGSNILDEGSLDDKQRTTKSNRGAIGLKGQTLYLVISTGSTVIDLAAVMDALDVDYALNVDGGGSSAMIFNGSYKIGPGRSIPNAIIVSRK